MEICLAFLESGLDYEICKEILDLKPQSLDDYVSQLFENNHNELVVMKQHFSNIHILDFMLSIQKFKTTLKSLILKALTYPIILYSLMYSLMLFFILFLLPQMFNIIELFDLQQNLLTILNITLKCVFTLISLINLVLIVLLVLLINKQRLKMFLNLNQNSKMLIFLKEIYTYQFSHFFHLLINKGFSTKLALQIMREGSTSYITSWIATLISYQLETGDAFEVSINNPLLDKQFILLCQLGSKNNQLIELLETYHMTIQKRIHDRINQIGSIIKSITYVLLGFLIIMMYQILLAPMSLLGNF